MWGEDCASEMATQMVDEDHYAREARVFIAAQGPMLSGYSPEALLNALPSRTS